MARSRWSLLSAKSDRRLDNGIPAPGVERVTAEQALHGHPPAAQEAVAPQGVARVHRARGRKAAARSEKRREYGAVARQNQVCDAEGQVCNDGR